MNHLDTLERMITDRVRSECREQVRAIVEPMMVGRLHAAQQAGFGYMTVSPTELALMQWVYPSAQTFPTTDAVSVHTFGGLRVVVSEDPRPLGPDEGAPEDKRVTT